MFGAYTLESTPMSSGSSDNSGRRRFRGPHWVQALLRRPKFPRGKKMTPNPGSYPVSLEGTLDENLSRWKWLVKWFLAIPHFIVLVFLGLGVVFASIGAWFAI